MRGVVQNAIRPKMGVFLVRTRCAEPFVPRGEDRIEKFESSRADCIEKCEAGRAERIKKPPKAHGFIGVFGGGVSAAKFFRSVPSG